MSKILAEQLLAGIILADNDNREYIYLPGGEVGSEDPHCVFEKNGERAGDLPLEEAVELAKSLHLSPGRLRSLAHGRGEGMQYLN